MRKPVQTTTLREEVLGCYDMHHLGLYFGRTIRNVELAPKDADECWAPTPAFKKISAEYAKAFFDLCVKLLKHDVEAQKHKAGKTYEVRADLLRNYKTGEIRAVVAPQVVSIAFVEAVMNDPERPVRDLVTGEEMPNWQDEWHEYGGWHSHNTMGTTPSGTDNETEEKTPGVYGIFGKFKAAKGGGHEFEVYPSVVLPAHGSPKNKRRTKVAYPGEDGKLCVRPMEWSDVMEWDAECKATYHPSVLDIIMIEKPKSWPKPVTTSSVKVYDQRDWDKFRENWGGEFPSYWGQYGGMPEHLVRKGAQYDSRYHYTSDSGDKEIYAAVEDLLLKFFEWTPKKNPQSNPDFRKWRYQVVKAVELLSLPQEDADAEVLVEEILAPIVEDNTAFRIISEARLEELEALEAHHADNS